VLAGDFFGLQKTSLIGAVRQFPLRDRDCGKGRSGQCSNHRTDALLKAERLKPQIARMRLAMKGAESFHPTDVSLRGAPAVVPRYVGFHASDRAARGCAAEVFVMKGKGMLHG